MDNQKRSLYVFDWQKLRISLGFNDAEETLKSMQSCIDYVVANSETRVSFVAAIDRVIVLCKMTMQSLKGKKNRRNITDGRKAEIDACILVVEETLVNLSAKILDLVPSFVIDQEKRLADIREATTEDIKAIHTSLRRSWVSSHKRPGKIDAQGEYIQMLEAELYLRAVPYTPAIRPSIYE